MEIQYILVTTTSVSRHQTTQDKCYAKGVPGEDATWPMGWGRRTPAGHRSLGWHRTSPLGFLGAPPHCMTTQHNLKQFWGNAVMHGN